MICRNRLVLLLSNTTFQVLPQVANLRILTWWSPNILPQMSPAPTGDELSTGCTARQDPRPSSAFDPLRHRDCPRPHGSPVELPDICTGGQPRCGKVCNWISVRSNIFGPFETPLVTDPAPCNKLFGKDIMASMRHRELMPVLFLVGNDQRHRFKTKTGSNDQILCDNECVRDAGRHFYSRCRSALQPSHRSWIPLVQSE